MARPGPRNPAPPPALHERRVLMSAALAVAVVAAYVRVGGYGFIMFDDPGYVADNARVLRGLTWGNVRWALGTLHFSNWHPLTWLSYMLDVSLFGPAPGPMHLVNVALHAAAVVVLFLALDRLTGARWRSALVAALFALHPTRVESVAWISERKDLLSVLFGLLALLAYARYGRRPTGRAYGLVLLACAASLASKAMLISLPFVLLLLDFWPLGRIAWPFVLRLHPPMLSVGSAVRSHRGPESKHAQDERKGKEDSNQVPPVTWKRALLEKLPLLAMAAAVTAVGVLAQARGGAVSDLPLAERLANVPVAYASYVGKLLWPFELGVLYPYPPDGWPAWRVGASAALLVGATAGAVALVRRAPWVTAGWLWFLGTLVPVIGVVQLGAQAMADRYTYFPAIGLFVAAVWSVPAPPARLRLAAAGAVAALLLALGALTFRQAGLWGDEERLYRHTLAVTEKNARMHAVLAILLRSKGRLEEAYAEILESNQLWPGNPHDMMNLGIIARETGRLDVAEKALRGAVQAGPGFVPGWYALADLLRNTGRGEEAIGILRRVAAMEPGSGTAWAELGVQLHGAGRTEEAARAFAEAVRVAPGDFEVQRNAGIFGALTGRWDLAVEAFSRAARLRPGNPEIARRLAEARERARRPAN